MNNLSYGYPPSNNSSFSSQYASTPSNNTRFQRPRFPYAGPPSYPRPRSSASKPNPDSYSEKFMNTSYDSSRVSNDSYRNDGSGHVSDYSRGYMDSMQNNYGDSTLPMDNSLSMNRPQESFDSQMSSNSSAYFTCNDSFYSSPQKLSFLPNTPLSLQSDTMQSSFSKRGGLSSYSDTDFRKRTNTYFNLNSGGLAGFNQGTGLSGVGSFGRGLGTFRANNKGSNFRGKTGNRGNARGGRGGFQKKAPFSKGNNPSMASQCKWRCELCAIDFTSVIPYEMHLRGAKHLKKIKSQTAVCTMQNQISQVKEIDKPDGKKYYCEPCGVITNSQLQLQTHLDGTKHKAKVEQQQEPKQGPKETLENPNKIKLGKRKPPVNTEEKPSIANTLLNANGGVVRAAPAEFGEPQPSKSAKFSCNICGIIVNSDIQLQQHLTSKKHQAKVEGKPIIKKRKTPKPEGESQESQPEQEPMNQDETSSEATKKEVTNVVGVKTLTASFVHGETLK